MKIRVVWEYHPNESTRVATLHCDLELFFWTPGPEALIGLPSKEGKLTPDQKRLVDDLLSIHGVANVVVARYQILVERGGVFGWEEIKPRVEQVLATWVGAEGVVRKETAGR